MEFIPPAKPIIGDEERAAVDEVMRTGMLAQGEVVYSFEREFADLVVKGSDCVAVNSGTSALHLGLVAAGIGPGDEVIVPAFTFAATANSVALTGATPVFADIEPDYYSMSAASVRSAVTDRTKAIMPVHLYGHPANMTELQAIAVEHGLLVFEDAAQAHLAEWGGTQVGAFGAFGAFSLYPTKNMTSGEGGMVSSADADLLRMVRLLRNQGMEKQYANEVVGYNNRMTNIHAAIGRVQLTKLLGWTETRRRNAAFLDANLTGVATPPVHELATHVYHQYTVRVSDDRDGFMQALKDEHGVGSGAYYPTPVNRLASFQIEADLPETERAAREVVSLPVHPSLTQADLERIVAGVNAVASAGA